MLFPYFLPRLSNGKNKTSDFVREFSMHVYSFSSSYCSKTLNYGGTKSVVKGIYLIGTKESSLLVVDNP